MSDKAKVKAPPSPPFLIETIMPHHEVHLLAGPSGSGKTRWLLHTLVNDWAKGFPVLGLKSYPCPWVYVSADRSMASVERTLTDMGINPALVPTIAAWDNETSALGIVEDVRKIGAQLVVWEAFGSFVQAPYGATAIKKYLNWANRMCRDYDLTILGVVESPKMKPKDRYDNPRQRVSGAASWSHFSETIFVMDFTNAADVTDCRRELSILPRCGDGLEIPLIFDGSGRLIVRKREDDDMTVQ